jgi:P27 family predicted phage terminase small subunit
MAMGPRPKPTQLVELHGNPADRPIKKGIPEPTGLLSEPPDWMTADQRLSWRYVIENSPATLLKRIDRGVLATWCVAECLHREAAIAQAQTGQLLVRSADPGSMPFQSPYIPIINRQALIMMRAADHLGFSPASRPRIFSTAIDEEFNAPIRNRAAAQTETLENWLGEAPDATSIN